MAKIDLILEKNEKKLNISRFLGADIKEDDNDFITIKKIPVSIKNKLKFLAFNSFSGNLGKVIFKELKDKSITFEDYEKMNKIDQAQIMMNLKLNETDAKEMGKMTNDIAMYLIEYGVHKTNHSFTSSDGKPYHIDYEFFDMLGNEKLTNFVINEIKEFSNGLCLGELIEKESDQL